MAYKDTLNLPRTHFPMKGNLPKKEKELLKFWDDMDIYSAIRSARKDAGRKYVLHDGPPYANGNVHIGTALNKFLKDVVVKYWSMSGYDTPYVPGWDCHGMPIEHNVVKLLHEQKKSLSLPELRKECRAYAEKFVKVQREQFKRMGYIGDWEKPYLTMQYTYEARILETFKALVDMGFIYRGLRPIHWCPVCKTALANVEVEYGQHPSPSIYVRFPLKAALAGVEGPASILIWTTTPWTLPANMAIAVKADYDYVAFSADGEALIVAEDLLPAVASELEMAEPRVLKRMKGAELDNLKCQTPMSERESVVIMADFVSLEQGTGCVHIAPGHGYDDYQTGMKYGLDIVCPVDEAGRFTDEVPEYAGKSVFDANPAITESLKKKGTIIASGQMTHSYPQCWRCQSPLIFRAVEQWFFDVEKDDLRQRCLDKAGGVRWVPDWSEDRMVDALQARPDWCLSRQRAWGVPIPAVRCKGCGEVFLDSGVVDRLTSLVRENGSDVWFTAGMEDLVPSGTVCPKCGRGEFEKETDILDVWFDSSVSNLTVVKDRGDPWPVDLFLEAVDQHRGWFQLSLIVGVATEDVSPYKACLTHGLVLDPKRRKMSKKLGNAVAPEEIWTKYGADILRLWFASVDYTRDMGFGDEMLSPVVDVYRKIRNTFRFMLGNLADYDDEENRVPYDELPELARYILFKLDDMVAKARAAYEEFRFFKVYHMVHDFCVCTLSQFYFDIMKDILYTYAPDSSERRSVQTVLHDVLSSLTRLMAPIISFTCEEVWQARPAGTQGGSVFLTAMPEPSESRLDEKTAERWEKLLAVREEVLVALERARESKMIGNALEARITLSSRDQGLRELLKGNSQDLAQFFIVSGVEVHESEGHLPSHAHKGEKADVTVVVEKAVGDKCRRCWMYSESVGESDDYPDVCDKCVAAMSEIGGR